MPYSEALDVIVAKILGEDRGERLGELLLAVAQAGSADASRSHCEVIAYSASGLPGESGV